MGADEPSVREDTMTFRTCAAALCLAFAVPTFAATSQQQRMTDCNAKAAAKRGPERKAFMSACLKGEDMAAPAASRQQRMKDCNAKAAGKKGPERRSFMSACLKG